MKSSVVGCGRNRHILSVDIYFREIFGVTNEIFWSGSFFNSSSQSIVD
jgi:hypothetical protein